MNRDSALRRLRACLRLAASNNPNEAAAALRQAQKLMEQFGLTQADAEDSMLGDFAASTGHRRFDLPEHYVRLLKVVAMHFRCEPLLDCNERGTVQCRFIGPRAASEVAVYAFVVLRRQMIRDVGKHTSRIRKRANKESRARNFGIGWVNAIRDQLDVRELSIEESDRAKAHIDAHFGGSVDKAPRAVAKKSWKYEDYRAGKAAGAKAQLHSGLSGSDKHRLEHLS